jgi:hypothetical protein
MAKAHHTQKYKIKHLQGIKKESNKKGQQNQEEVPKEAAKRIKPADVTQVKRRESITIQLSKIQNHTKRSPSGREQGPGEDRADERREARSFFFTWKHTQSGAFLYLERSSWHDANRVIRRVLDGTSYHFCEDG